MRKILSLLLLMTATMMSWTSAFAQDASYPTYDDEYAAALAAIEDGAKYYISTDVDGAKYYITNTGYMTATKADAGLFTLTKVENDGTQNGGVFKQFGFHINAGSNFTNAPLSDGKAVLTPGKFSTSSDSRVAWESQVLFLKDGKYAIRACNTTYGESSWADCGRVFFNYAIAEANAVAQYSYDAAFVWNFTKAGATVTVSYQLYESDGTTKVGDPVNVTQEAGSEVNVPASLTSVYAYTYEVSGTVGDENCEIKIVRTFKPGVVHALGDLSNAKAYYIGCKRGAFLTKEGYLASTAHSSLTNATPTNFAVISYEENLYLYSVVDGKFVTNTGALETMPTHGTGDALQLQLTADPFFLGYFTIDGTNYGINTNGNNPYGYVINTWMNADEGNQYYLVAETDFDATNAIKALDEYFHPSYYLTYVIKDAEGNTLATYADVPTTLGAKITNLPADYVKPFCTYNTVDVTVAEQYTTVEFIATWNGPIALAKGYDNITWQNIYINRGEDNHWYLANGETVPTFVQNPTEKQRASEYYQWGFVGNVYQGIKIYNKATGNTKTLNSSSTVAMVEGEYVFDQFVNNNGGILIGKGGQYLNQSGGATSTKLGTWGSTNDQGSTWFVSEVPDIPVTTVYFDYTYNGQVVNTVSVPGLGIGDPVPAVPTTVPDFTTIEVPSVEGLTVTENMRITVPATWNGPFNLASDFASAHWYDMSIRATWYVTSNNKDDDGALKTVNANAVGLVEDAYQWAFVGDPWHVYLYNKAEGSSKVYAWTSTGNASIPAFVDAATGNYWQIRKSTASGDTYANAFMLTIPNLGYQVNQYGGAGGSLKIWTSTGTGDAGSAFKVFDVPTNFAEYFNSEIAQYFDGKYFVFNDEVKASMGYDPAYKENCPFEAYKTMKEKLTDELTGNIANYVLPETGYYYLKNKNYPSKGYMGIDPSDANMYGDYVAPTEAKHVVKLIKTGDVTYNISLMGKYAPATVAQSTPVKASDEAGTYTVVITQPGYAAFQADTEAQYSALHRRSEGDIVGWTVDADASLWAAEDATSINIAVGPAGYATTYMPFPLEIGESLAVPAAKGAWTFDDGTTGTLTATSGVTVANGVATVPVGDNLAMATGAESLGTYTLMMDVKVVNEDKGRYTSLYKASDTSEDGAIFIYNHRTNGRRIGINAGNMGYGGSYELDTWYRVVVSCENSLPTVYVNGTKVVAATAASATHWTLGSVVRFFADNDGDEENLVQADELRFWDVALTADEVSMLGAYGDPEPVASSVVAYAGVINQTWLDLVEIKGTIPAMTGVVLKGDPGVYEFAIAKTEADPIEENDLKGTLEPIAATGLYVLAKPEGEPIGFYLAESGTIKAGKAYLEYNGAAGIKAFQFAGDATGIANVEKNVENGPIYNLAGQRLNKVQKGINIVNGKKVLY